MRLLAHTQIPAVWSRAFLSTAGLSDTLRERTSEHGSLHHTTLVSLGRASAIWMGEARRWSAYARRLGTIRPMGRWRRLAHRASKAWGHLATTGGEFEDRASTPDPAGFGGRGFASFEGRIVRTVVCQRLGGGGGGTWQAGAAPEMRGASCEDMWSEQLEKMRIG